MDPEEFALGFTSWTASLADTVEGVIAIDGKTVRRSHGGEGQRAIHMVSAWSSANRLILAQRKVDMNSNEITAIPEVLRLLDCTDAVVTIDAMGCQRSIAEQIVEQKGDYGLAVKENQKALYDDIVDTFQQTALADDAEVSSEKGHGRVEVRHSKVITDAAIVDWGQEQHHWPSLTAIGMIETERTVRGKVGHERRYYVMSRRMSAEQFGPTVRSHWGIENSVHWVLDMAFREDESRTRTGNAAENLSTIRRLVINLVRQNPKRTRGIQGSRYKASIDQHYLLQLLQGI